MLLILSVTGGAVALRQWQAAAAQRREAVLQQRLAVARGLQVQAESLRTADPQTALKLGIAAHSIKPDTETALSLAVTLTESRYLGSVAGPTAEAFGPEQATELLFFLAKVLENTIRAWLDLQE